MFDIVTVVLATIDKDKIVEFMFIEGGGGDGGGGLSV